MILNIIQNIEKIKNTKNAILKGETMEFSELYKVLMEIVKKEVPEKCKNLLDDKILKK